jgi:hypothetical protein
MNKETFMASLSSTIARSQVESSLSQHCEAVGAAINSGDIGQTVTAVQQLILRYYDNVRGQADESFESAKRVARWGFVLLAVTIAYVMFMDLLPHIWVGFLKSDRNPMDIGAIGIIGGSVMEVVAGVQFALYGRATKQFGAFHICLERTHRYLL